MKFESHDGMADQNSLKPTYFLKNNEKPQRAACYNIKN